MEGCCHNSWHSGKAVLQTVWLLGQVRDAMSVLCDSAGAGKALARLLLACFLDAVCLAAKQIVLCR